MIDTGNGSVTAKTWNSFISESCRNYDSQDQNFGGTPVPLRYSRSAHRGEL